MVSGDTGKFLVTLPIVMTAALVSSRIVSMTFVPLLGYYLLRPAKVLTLPMEQRRHQGFSGRYFRLGEWCIEHRWMSFLALDWDTGGRILLWLPAQERVFPE